MTPAAKGSRMVIVPDAASPSANPQDAVSVHELLGQAIGSQVPRFADVENVEDLLRQAVVRGTYADDMSDRVNDAIARYRELTGPIATIVEEWRVSGSQDGLAPFEFTYRSVDTRWDGDAEGAARKFIATIAGRQDWVDGPHLDRRTVTYGERQRVEIDA